MITCRRAAELLSRELDVDLPLHQRMLLRVHVFVCGACRRFRRQIAEIDRVATVLLKDSRPRGPGMPAAAKVRLNQMVDERLNENI